MVYGRFSFSSEIHDEAMLPPFKGSTFRGAFGSALKRVVCALKSQECQTCLLGSRCVYALFFEQTSGKPHQTAASSPHPFVIEPPLTTKVRFIPSEAFDFTLMLFGRAIDYLPYCIYAFEQMGEIGIGKHINGKRAKFMLKTVTSLTSSPTTCIYSSHDRRLASGDFTSKLTFQKPSSDIRQITIHLKTPLRVKHENRLKADLPFHILIRTALRRISALFACYGDGEPPLDYKGLVQRAQAIEIEKSGLSWFDWERYSSRQDVKMFMGGMVGSVSYTGDLTEFWPLLRLSEELHIGKQSTFGLGQIVMD